MSEGTFLSRMQSVKEEVLKEHIEARKSAKVERSAYSNMPAKSRELSECLFSLYKDENFKRFLHYLNESTADILRHAFKKHALCNSELSGEVANFNHGRYIQMLALKSEMDQLVSTYADQLKGGDDGQS